MLRTLFYRHFDRFSGGHLKVWDYFNHVKSSPKHRAEIYFSPRSTWDDSNPWREEKHRAPESWSIGGADLLFLGGTDWKVLSASDRRRPPVPIINLIQHVKHADPTDKRYRYLRHRAIRICVSEEVASALRDSGEVKGPLFVIPNGLDHGLLAAPVNFAAKPVDVLIAGLKRPELAQRIKERLATLGKKVETLINQLPRRAFLDELSRSTVTVFLPHATEGFYLPALEGMALQTLVVCPDCVGNRSFCRSGDNCYRPEYAEDALVMAVQAALSLSPTDIDHLLSNARQTASEHSLLAERRSFLEILDNVPQLW